MSNEIKICDIQNIVLNGKKATTFSIYELINNTWVFSSNDFIFGHYKRKSTILNKHIAFNQSH